MAIDIKIACEIRDGQVWPKNPDLYMQKLRDAGDANDCQLTITGNNVRSPNQHRYAFAVCNVIAETEQEQGWPNSTAYRVYKRIEKLYCKDIEINEKTGKEREITKALKEQDPDTFWNIIEEVRQVAMQTYDIHIKTPAEYYRLTEQAYDLWREGVITFAEARKQSNKQSENYG